MLLYASACSMMVSLATLIFKLVRDMVKLTVVSKCLSQFAWVLSSSAPVSWRPLNAAPPYRRSHWTLFVCAALYAAPLVAAQSLLDPEKLPAI